MSRSAAVFPTRPTLLKYYVRNTKFKSNKVRRVKYFGVKSNLVLNSRNFGLSRPRVGSINFLDVIIFANVLRTVDSFGCPQKQQCVLRFGVSTPGSGFFGDDQTDRAASREVAFNRAFPRIFYDISETWHVLEISDSSRLVLEIPLGYEISRA